MSYARVVNGTIPNKIIERKVRMNTISKTAEKQEFITLEVSQIGFVVYGIGPGAKNYTYRGEVLMDFLENLWKKMWGLKDELNKAWDSLDKKNPESPKNLPFIKKILAVGWWAYALAVELKPFTKASVDGHPLRRMFLERLEEIFTKCFAAAHLYGLPDESIVGLRGLLTDFEVNGGIDQKTGKEGCGFGTSLLIYYIAYFASTNRKPLAYERFGELMEALAALIANRYPRVSPRFVEHLTCLVEETNFGFGSKEVQSEAKTQMLEKLAGLKESLTAKIAEAA